MEIALHLYSTKHNMHFVFSLLWWSHWSRLVSVSTGVNKPISHDRPLPAEVLWLQIAPRGITELTCLLFLSSLLCALHACFWFAWPLVIFMEMPFPCIALGANAALGFMWHRCLGSENPVAVPSYSTLWCQSIPRISLRLRSFKHDCILLVCQDLHKHVISINPQEMLLGRPTFTFVHTNARAAVFPPSRICSVFPHDSCGIRPISLFLPVSSLLAAKCMWSLWDLLYRYSWTSLFCNCLRSFNEFPWCRTVGGL